MRARLGSVNLLRQSGITSPRIVAAQTLCAEVILIEVPRGFIVDPYAGLERELARRHDLQLIPDTTFRQFVLTSPAAPPGIWLGGP